jgi:hypothetical protein
MEEGKTEDKRQREKTGMGRQKARVVLEPRTRAFVTPSPWSHKDVSCILCPLSFLFLVAAPVCRVKREDSDSD